MVYGSEYKDPYETLINLTFNIIWLQKEVDILIYHSQNYSHMIIYPHLIFENKETMLYAKCRLNKLSYSMLRYGICFVL